jgi:hypothetical protein
MHKRQPTEPLHADVRYEPSDVSVRGVLAFGFGLAVLTVVAHLVPAWLMPVLQRREEALHPAPPAIAKERPRLPQDLTRIPPPRLEESETEALQALRAEEERLLHSREWIDPQNKIARIPIEEAMRLLTDPNTAERLGVQVRTPPPASDQKKKSLDKRE